MRNRCNRLVIVLLCTLLHYKLHFAEADETSADLHKSLIATLMTRLWAKSDATQNFLISPQEVFELYEQLYASSEDASVESELDVTYVAQPVVVSNTLHGTHFEHVLEFAQKLKNAQLMRQARKSPESPQSEESEQPEQQSTADIELINDVTLNARWTQNFQKRDTHKHTFYHTPEEHVYTEFMRKDDIFRYAELPALNATALELRVQCNRIGVLFLRPHKVDGLAALRQQISSNLSLIDEIVQQRLQPTVVRAVIPKFKLNTAVHLHDIFAELKGRAGNGSVEMPANPIGHIVQHCHLEVNEQGIGELDHSTVLFWNTYSSLRVAPINFELNQPFLFFIRNPEGIQFVGHVVEL